MINFLQTKEWQGFWLTANDSNSHKILDIQNQKVYEYPWYFGYKFWYLPRTNLDFENQKDVDTFNLIYQKAKTESKVAFLQFGLNFENYANYETPKSFVQKFETDFELKLNSARKNLQWLETTVLLTEKINFDENQKDTTPELQLANIKHFWEINQVFFKERNENIRRYTKRSLDQGWKIDSQKVGENFEKFYKLMKQTAQRQKFFLHSKKYYKTLFDQEFSYLFLLLDENGEPQSCWFGICLEDTLVYLYGANTEIGLQKKAQYLDHLVALYLAKKLGAKKYDLGGLGENKGYSKFKLNYHGELEKYFGEWELVTSKMPYFGLKMLFKIVDLFRK